MVYRTIIYGLWKIFIRQIRMSLERNDLNLTLKFYTFYIFTVTIIIPLNMLPIMRLILKNLVEQE